MARSKVWKYYDKVDYNTAQCQLCEKVIKACGNTSNLRKHMKTHPQIDLNDNDSIVVRGIYKRNPADNGSKKSNRKLAGSQPYLISNDEQPNSNAQMSVSTAVNNIQIQEGTIDRTHAVVNERNSMNAWAAMEAQSAAV